MKDLMKLMSKLTLFVVALLAGVWSFAQEAGARADVDLTETGENPWYLNPAVMLVSFGVLVLLVVGVIRSNNRSDA